MAAVILSAFRASTVDVDIIKRMGPLIFLGGGAGIVITRSMYHANNEVLRWIWIFFGSSLALKMFLGRDDWKTLTPCRDLHGWRSEITAFSHRLISTSTLMSIGSAMFTVLCCMHGARRTESGWHWRRTLGMILAILWIASYIIFRYRTSLETTAIFARLATSAFRCLHAVRREDRAHCIVSSKARARGSRGRASSRPSSSGTSLWALLTQYTAGTNKRLEISSYYKGQ